MAKPQVIQKLKHGKLLCNAVFPSFVDTWNYMTSRVENIRGDGDIRPDSGFIKIDNTDPEHPVIRLNYNAFRTANSINVDGCSISCYMSDSPDLSNDIVYQLNGFNDLSNTQTNLSGYEFIVRHDGEVKYLSADLPSGGGGSSGAFSYDSATHTINDGMYLRARQYVFVNSATVSNAGYAYLEVSMGVSGGAQIITGASSIPNATNNTMCIPLYYFDQDLEIQNDYRGAPTVQIWEAN